MNTPAKTIIEIDGGALTLERVGFDTEIFGIEVARITECKAPNPEALDRLHAAAVDRATSAGFAHVSRRVLATEYAEITALERAGHHLLDVGVIFDHDLRGVAPSKEVFSKNGVRVAIEKDVERAVAECYGIFRTSRYYHDPAFTAEGADEVHRRWIWNCFRGRADVVLVLEDANAFVTCAVDASGVGDIALFGVAPSAQGKGAGQRLLGGAIAWFAEKAKRAEVKTQATNYAAARMYERGGFRLVRSELTYGRRIGK